MLVAWDGSCLTSSILNPAGCEKLAGQERLLPRKLFLSIRQGVRSLLARVGSCPTSLILNPAGCEELAGRG